MWLLVTTWRSIVWVAQVGSRGEAVGIKVIASHGAILVQVPWPVNGPYLLLRTFIECILNKT